MRARRAFYSPSQIKFKTEKLQFSKLYNKQNKHILKIIRRFLSIVYIAPGIWNYFFKITSINIMAGIFISPFLQIYTLILQNKIVNLDILFNYDHATYKL